MATLPVVIANRPFATETITGMQMPDGIFDAALIKMRINAHFRNNGSTALAGAVYCEGTSHPGVRVAARTHSTNLPAGAATLLTWDIDVSAAPPGEHRVSFIVESGGVRHRIIRKIFVSRTSFDTASGMLMIQTPEYRLGMTITELLGPTGGLKGRAADSLPQQWNVIDALSTYLRDPGGKVELGNQPFLIKTFDVVATPTSPYAGTHGRLPFNDPWWKTLLVVLAVILMIAAMIVAVVLASGSIALTGGGSAIGIAVIFACCATPASIVAAGLGVASLASGFIAALADDADPIWRGQAQTVPNAGELTVGERLHCEIAYPEAVVGGEPFAVDANWTYERDTIDAGGAAQTRSFTASDSNRNIHVLRRYEINAHDVVRASRKEEWIVRGRFFDADDVVMRGDDLFVQCYLVGPNGQEHRLVMQDNGLARDTEPNDGWYTGVWQPRQSSGGQTGDEGMWRFYVVAQDVNDAQPSMTPQEAATHIGGMVRTGQLSVSTTGGTCSFVPDGSVNVL